MKIMLVDDNEANNYFHCLMMEKAGYKKEEILCYTSAEKAIEALRIWNSKNEKLPNVILLDINMPYINGWEFLEKIRKIWEENKPHITIYLVSNSRHPSDIKKADNEIMVKDIKEKHLDPAFFEVLKQNQSS